MRRVWHSKLHRITERGMWHSLISNWLPLIFLLGVLTLCEPVSCGSHETPHLRHDRSSYYDTSYTPQNLAQPLVRDYSVATQRPQVQAHPQAHAQRQPMPQQQYDAVRVEQQTVVNYQQQRQRQRQRQLNATQLHTDEQHGVDPSGYRSTLQERIANIFELGPGEGVKLFNNTFSRNSTMLTPLPADRLSMSNQTIKVQRMPDGKLSWSLNSMLPFQNATQTVDSIRNPVKYTPDFVFPDGDVQCEERIQTLCTKVRNYPDRNYLETILEPELSKFEKFFFEDLIEPQDFKQRMNYEPDEEPLCKSREVINYPQSGETLDAIKMLILNTDKFKQGVRVELCENEGEPCKKEFLGSLPTHYRSSCKQMYIYRQLVALTPDKKEITTGIFKIPSCCKCVIKQLK